MALSSRPPRLCSNCATVSSKGRAIRSQRQSMERHLGRSMLDRSGCGRVPWRLLASMLAETEEVRFTLLHRLRDTTVLDRHLSAATFLGKRHLRRSRPPGSLVWCCVLMAGRRVDQEVRPSALAVGSMDVSFRRRAHVVAGEGFEQAVGYRVLEFPLSLRSFDLAAKHVSRLRFVVIIIDAC